MNAYISASIYSILIDSARNQKYNIYIRKFQMRYSRITKRMPVVSLQLDAFSEVNSGLYIQNNYGKLRISLTAVLTALILNFILNFNFSYFLEMMQYVVIIFKGIFGNILANAKCILTKLISIYEIMPCLSLRVINASESKSCA